MIAPTEAQLARMLNALDQGYTPEKVLTEGQRLTQDMTERIIDTLVKRGQAKRLAGCVTLA